MIYDETQKNRHPDIGRRFDCRNVYTGIGCKQYRNNIEYTVDFATGGSYCGIYKNNRCGARSRCTGAEYFGKK